MLSKSLRGVPGIHGVYSDYINGQPLFSTDDQVLDGSGDCAGLLQFVKPVSPTSVVLMKSSQDPGTIDIITPQKRWVVTNDSQSGNSVDLSRGSEALQVGLRVGAPSPGHNASVDHMLEYAVYGPHFIGKYLPHAGPKGTDIYCVQPSAVKSNMHWSKAFHYTSLVNDAGYQPDKHEMWKFMTVDS
ncbi:hypothetical protein Pmar_PMAR021700 [Perkinsus marinus ATCC 50983]|uniref:Uncharacterized protein n=1 Tax=Perkinsus marinus (strain ATCC 50983 / TXsc) TaxID=423536 RepID=C5L2F7_PERM5|nr:hypothetical protein Pmar_PMAR021700 [Perkinsus marinus ATCC 50983]EER09051.1 hypothetical protein Pmar_PMAR021700 [Perkinsus marinus ATCC 50983]|eukprot:XP_002777235.1 hypothetical protein Pmar_PMAR021700 [Perkinsus marinus ATCC 50983]